MKASEYWDREVTEPVTPPERSWMAHPLVREYINQSVSGPAGGWPLDWFQATYPQQFQRVLSIGCGTGALERDLLRRGVAKSVVAFDASDESLAIARQSAATEGFAEQVTYFNADFNSVRLPKRAYDLICFHQSLHHVANLEQLMRQVSRAIAPGGLLYLEEFVGPSRDDWNEYRIRWYRALYEFFPRTIRYFDAFAMPVQEEDPSEAIRSSEILSTLCVGFRIEHFRGYGGNLLALLFPDLLVERLEDDLVRTIIRAEQALIAAGDPHFHAVITLRRKEGLLARVVATLRYVLQPHFPRLTSELRFLRNRYRGRAAESSSKPGQ